MTNKTLTEKRFKEILEENKQEFIKKRFNNLQQFLGKGNFWFWVIGIGFAGLTFLWIIAMTFTTSILFLAQNGYISTLRMGLGVYDFLSNGALFFLIGAVIFKIIKYFHKKKGLNNGK